MNMNVKEVNENILSLLKDLVERTENDEIEWVFNKDSGEVCNDNEDRATFITKNAYAHDNNVYVLHFTRRLVSSGNIIRINTKTDSAHRTYDELEVVVWDISNKTGYNGSIPNTRSTIINKYTVNSGYMGDDINIIIEEELDSLYGFIYKKLLLDSNVLINKCLANAMYAIINGEVVADDRN